MQIIDLSVTISLGMTVFPGDPGVRLELKDSFPDDVCQVTMLHFGSHTATHVDAPRHFLPEGTVIDDVPLDSFVGSAIAFRVIFDGKTEDGHPIMTISEAQKSRIQEHDRIIFSTGWERHTATPQYFRNYPVFSEELLAFLASKSPKLIGADLPTLASASDPFHMHRLLFRNQTVFAEGLVGLAPLCEKRFFFSAAPLKLDGGDGSPVRAYAVLENS